ncbi:MAG TPA: glycogen debranching enzyme, partial [Actinospica sp.]|nr:glycogen debranching enzyme [Actinospica sp.]
MAAQAWPGRAYPLGATYDGDGTNFALFSEAATAVELCLFDDAGREERVRLAEVDAFTHHAYLPGVGPGQRYGFRVDGLYDPASGRRCNPGKLLLDPYALAFEGDIGWDSALFGYTFGHPEVRDGRDSAPHTMRSVVVDPRFDWTGEFGAEQ